MSKISTKIRLYGICSQRQDDANAALLGWKLYNYSSIIGDHTNKLTRHIKQTYLPKLHITDCSRRTELDPQLSVKNYPHGAVQPAVLFFVGNRPALGWACTPTPTNLQGALGRPVPTAVWKVVEECKVMADDDVAFDMNDGEGLPQTVTFCQACKNCCQCIIL